MNSQTLLTLCYWLTFIGIFFTLMGGIGTYYFGGQVQKEKDKEHTKTIGELQTTVSNSRKDLEAEREKVARLESQAAVIRSLGAELQVEFRGRWKDKPFPDQLLSPIDREFYVYLETSDKTSTDIIKLHPVEYYDLKELASGQGRFHARQAVRVGDFPLGKPIDVLLAFDKVGIHIPFILYQEFVEPKVSIENVRLKFILNGEALDTLSFAPHAEVPVRIYGNAALHGQVISGLLISHGPKNVGSEPFDAIHRSHTPHFSCFSLHCFTPHMPTLRGCGPWRSARRA